MAESMRAGVGVGLALGALVLLLVRLHAQGQSQTVHANHMPSLAQPILAASTMRATRASKTALAHAYFLSGNTLLPGIPSGKQQVKRRCLGRGEGRRAAHLRLICSAACRSDAAADCQVCVCATDATVRWCAAAVVARSSAAWRRVLERHVVRRQQAHCFGRRH
jgi:hypothetical protein